LTDKAALSVESISEILSSIPDSKKSNYHEDLIQKIYLKFQSARVNDSEVLADLQRRIGDKSVLLLAPGKTILSEKDKITKFIQEEDPFIFSLNFRPDDIQVDRVFISNERRFLDQQHLQDVIVTSNIKADDVAKLNYGSYLNNSEMADNSALMLLKVLIKLGIKTVTCAGLDGFKSGNDNYVKTELINNAKLGWDEDRRNSVMDEMLCRFSKKIGIKFITTTIYEIPEAKI
jgi:4-hydroxy 2-oxovalerate aldolase